MDLIGSYPNRRDLADTPVRAVQQLRKADTERLIAAFTAGMSKRKLAERYGISESSVKRLIRQHAAPKPSRGLSILA